MLFRGIILNVYNLTAQMDASQIDSYVCAWPSVYLEEKSRINQIKSKRLLKT